MNRYHYLLSYIGKTLPVLLAIVLFISACAPAGFPGGPSSTPTAEPSVTPTPQSTAAVDAALQELAKKLGIELSKIKVISIEEIDWPDACLGVARSGEMCAQVITPGFKIILQVEGQTYEYHTNLDGSVLALATKPSVENKLPVFVYHREGGIAGFCDDVIAYANGKAKVSSCKISKAAEVTLPTAQADNINQWLKEFSDFDYQHKDDAVADAMTLSLVFSGNGAKEASETDIQAMLDLLSQIAFQYGR